MILKVDWDCKGLSKWMERFTFVYPMLRFSGLVINYGWCYKTKKGWHVYMQTSRTLSLNEINMFESWFGSDYKKQVYGYVEHDNILFRVKAGKVNEHFARAETKKLLEVIAKINKRKYKRQTWKVKMPKPS